MSYIRFENLNKSFGSNHVLRDINLEVKKGELVTLLGPSGCGKSTLLRCLAGLERVSSGRIYLDGQDITDVSPRYRGIGMVFQQYSLFPNMNVRQNVSYGLKIQKKPRQEIDRKVEEILEIVGLSEKIDQFPMQLSGGQQQRVALARAIVTEPKVLLLDEPLSAIDALLRRNLQIEIRRIQQQLDITTIFVTHDQTEAMVMSDTIHLFNAGQIEQSGTPVEIYTKPATKFAATFIGNYNLLPAKQFNPVFGTEFACSDVAIRPEIIKLGKTAPDGTDLCAARGTVSSLISHGSVIRYTVDFGSIQLQADSVYEKELPVSVGEEIFASMEKGLIIEI